MKYVLAHPPNVMRKVKNLVVLIRDLKQLHTTAEMRCLPSTSLNGKC